MACCRKGSFPLPAAGRAVTCRISLTSSPRGTLAPVRGRTIWRQGTDGDGPQANRAALRAIMDHWLRLGVSGFRADMAYSLVKDDPGRAETARLWGGVRGWLDRAHPDAALLSEWGDPSLAAGCTTPSGPSGGTRSAGWRTARWRRSTAAIPRQRSRPSRRSSASPAHEGIGLLPLRGPGGGRQVRGLGCRGRAVGVDAAPGRLRGVRRPACRRSSSAGRAESGWTRGGYGQVTEKETSLADCSPGCSARRTCGGRSPSPTWRRWRQLAAAEPEKPRTSYGSFDDTSYRRERADGRPRRVA